jgi:fructan beta-fructosidase
MGKQKKGRTRQPTLPTRQVGGMAIAAKWPIHEALLSKGWNEEGVVVTILVARRSPNSGKIAAGLFLVDLACLGVKSAQVALFKGVADYTSGIRAHALRLQPMAPAGFNLVAKIIFTGLDYAGALGFKPDPVFSQAQHLLSGANLDAEPTPVPTGGPEGKPFFVNGPRDDARRIVDHLTRTLGPGNFHYMLQGTKEDLGLPDDVDLHFQQSAPSLPDAADPYRPLLHFTPREGWMNDPNGLVYFDGEYHLFFQYLWPRTWGHAVSADLMHWTELPLALDADELGQIWSGSAVVDWRDSSGFFGGAPGLVAIFTHRQEDSQSQSIAYSDDRGRTWHKYAHNPVIVNRDLPDFRDPKVFWYAPGNHWALALAAGDHIQFHTSTNLRQWTYASSFYPPRGERMGVFECPDLFPLPIENSAERQVWVLHLSRLNSRGSWMEHIFGEFDGTTFQPLDAQALPATTDYGRDFYAAVSWSDIPAEDGRRIWIGWANNWVYANHTPTTPWQGAMSLPRQLRLQQRADGLRLIQQPVVELLLLRTDLRQMTLQLTAAPQALTVRSAVFEMLVDLQLGQAQEVGIRVRVGEGQATTIGYRRQGGVLFLDRRQSGAVDFAPSFAGIDEAPLTPEADTIRLRIIVDRSVVEVFADDGAVVLTSLMFPDPASDGIELYALGGDDAVAEVQLYEFMQ